MSDTIIYCDGLCEPNPGGTATYGWVIYWKGKRARDGNGVVCRGAEATNNVAEYSAVIAAMEYLIGKNYTGEILIRSDSQLLIKQMQGTWRVGAEKIIPLYQKAQALAGKFASVEYEWIPRERNAEADLLSWKAYHGYL